MQKAKHDACVPVSYVIRRYRNVYGEWLAFEDDC